MTVIKIEQLNKDDFPELMTMLNEAFRTVKPDINAFDQMYPDVYYPDNSAMACQYAVRQNGRIAGCVGLIPVPLLICGQKVTIAGIAGVATLPEFRGLGLMKTILDYVQEEMISQSYAFSCLGGLRRLYMPWGYEMVTNQHTLTLSRLSPGYENYAGKLPGRLSQAPVETSNWPALWSQCQTYPALTVCGESQLFRKYQRLNLQAAYIDDPHGAHVLYSEKDAQATPVAWAGPVEMVGAILAEKLGRNWESATIRAPWYPDAYSAMFKELTSDYCLTRIGSISIVDLEKTLNVFKPHLKQRVQQYRLKGATRLVMGPAGKFPAQEILLEADGDDLSISHSDTHAAAERIELTRWQMIELMFTPFVVDWSVNLSANARWLTALFPLPFYRLPIYAV